MSNMFISTKRYCKEKRYKELQYASRYRILLKELLGVTSKRDKRYIRLTPIPKKSKYSTCAKIRVNDRRKKRRNLHNECRQIYKEY